MTSEALTPDVVWGTFFRSSYCVNSDCVEVALSNRGDVLLRDSKGGNDGPQLRFSRSEWSAFLRGAQSGQFDVPDIG